MGLGPAGWFAALLHTVSHSLVKGGMFMLAGNVMEGYQTRRMGEVHGMLRSMPGTGMLWLAGFLALTGTPPFSLFLSEFWLLQATLSTGHTGLAIALMAALAAIFLGMSRGVLGMAQGGSTGRRHESRDALLAPRALLGLALVLGLTLPGPLSSLLQAAARQLGPT
jgi:hydrogenase-4 component F